MPFFLFYFIEEYFIHGKMPQVQVYNPMSFVTTTTKIRNPSLSPQSLPCPVLAIHTPAPAPSTQSAFSCPSSEVSRILCESDRAALVFHVWLPSRNITTLRFIQVALVQVTFSRCGRYIPSHRHTTGSCAHQLMGTWVLSSF